MRNVVAAGFWKWIAAVAVLAASAADAQDSTAKPPAAAPIARYKLRVLGTFDEQSGDPIDGVEVMDVGSGTTAITTKTGIVSLFFLPDGVSLLRLRKLGFSPLTMNVTISPVDTIPITVVMTRSAQELPAVVTKDSTRLYISPALNGFVERMHAGNGGHFIDDSTLRKMDADPLSIALRRLPGATVQNGHLLSTRTSSSGPVMRSARPGLTCNVSVYENGVLLYKSGSKMTPPDFDRLEVDAYAGVEFYASSASYPAWISAMDNPCGVLLLWTRER
jgi:hypothetical protein